MKKDFQYSIIADQAGQRLDSFLANQAEIGLARTQVHKLIEEGLVKLNNKVAKPGYKLKLNDQIELTVPEPKKLEAIAENILLDIVYEDADLVVVNKPQGMVVHPAAGNYSGTLVNALMAHCQDLSGIGGVMRPGIVHRLDKDTSGLLVIAKNDFSHQSLTKQFKDKTVVKQYLALVHGVIKQDSGVIETEVGRHPRHRKKMAVLRNIEESDKGKWRHALTEYKVLQRFSAKGGSDSGGRGYTLVEVTLKTGRTHQIRIHLNYLGYGVVGDPLYGPKREKFNLKGQLLHSAKLGFIHPRTGKYVEFERDMPEDMKRIIKIIS